MQSWDLVSRPFLQVLVLKVSGLILLSKVTGLGHKPVVLKLSILQAYGFVKLLWFNKFFSVVLVSKKEPKQIEKMPEIWKNSTSKW